MHDRLLSPLNRCFASLARRRLPNETAEALLKLLPRIVTSTPTVAGPVVRLMLLVAGLAAASLLDVGGSAKRLHMTYSLPITGELIWLPTSPTAGGTSSPTHAADHQPAWLTVLPKVKLPPSEMVTLQVSSPRASARESPWEQQ